MRLGGRAAAWPAAALLLAVLILQGVRWHDRLLASSLVRQVELVSMSAAGGGPQAMGRLLPYVLAPLHRAAEADPAAVEVPLARGSVYLLMHQPQEAADAYRQALALEPHPEIYLHLGDAQLAAGNLEQARRSYHDALLLDPWLQRLVPGGL
jgi:tetratricopeptide (TPR) repeat protein